MVVGLVYKNPGNVGLLRLLSSPPGRVLDCGCGAGDNARLLSGRGWRVTGVTIDPQEQEAARQFCEAVYLADLENGLPTSAGVVRLTWSWAVMFWNISRGLSTSSARCVIG